MSDAITESKTNKEQDFHALNEKLGQVIEKIEIYSVYAGKILYIMYKSKGFQKLGYDSWEEYLSGGIKGGEYSISKAQASKLMSVFEKWCILHGHDMKELVTDSEKLYIASLVLEAGHNDDCKCQEILHDAIALSRTDLRIKYLGEEENKPRQKRMVECPKCHARFKL